MNLIDKLQNYFSKLLDINISQTLLRTGIYKVARKLIKVIELKLRTVAFSNLKTI